MYGRVARHQVLVQTCARVLGRAARFPRTGPKGEKGVEKPTQYSEAPPIKAIVTSL